MLLLLWPLYSLGQDKEFVVDSVVNRLAADADEHIRREEWQLAADTYKEVLRVHLKDEYSFFLKGVAEYKNENFEAVVQDMTKAIELLPKNKLIACGFLWHDNRYYKSGDGYFYTEKGMSINYKVCEVYLYRGAAKMNLKDYRGCIADLNKYLVKNKSNDVAYYLRAISKFNTGDYAGAKVDIQAAIIIEKMPNYYVLRGQCNANTGKKDAACLDFSRAGELGATNAYELIQSYCNK